MDITDFEFNCSSLLSLLQIIHFMTKLLPHPTKNRGVIIDASHFNLFLKNTIYSHNLARNIGAKYLEDTHLNLRNYILSPFNFNFFLMIYYLGFAENRWVKYL